MVEEKKDVPKKGHHVLGIHSAVIGQSTVFKAPVPEKPKQESKDEKAGS